MPRTIRARSTAMLVACLLCFTVAASLAAAPRTITIRMYAAEYTPRERAQSDRWDPPTYLWKLRDAYQKLHPEVKLEFLPYIASDPDFQTWLITQFKAGSAPDVGYQLFMEVNRNAYKGWFLDLTPCLDKPNPYVSGNVRWKDIFIPGVEQTGRLPNDRIYVLPTGIQGTAIFYNKEIFEKAGVSVPATWKEFMDVQRRIKDAGFIPFAFNMNGARYCSNWTLRCLQDVLYDPVMAEVKGVSGRIGRTMVEGSGVTQKELVAAIRKGTYSARDPRWQEQMRLLKEWSRYWDPGFAGLDQNGAYTEFITGKAAMVWMATAYLKPTNIDPLRKFEYGTFAFPTLTRESSQYATGVASPAIGGLTGSGSYFVDSSAVKRGTADTAIDWLMFITAPRNYVPMANDLGYFAPALRDTAGLDAALEPIVHQVEKGVFRMETYLRGLTVKYADQYYQVMQEYLADRKDLKTACAEIQKYMDQAALDLIAANKWTDME